MAAESFHDFFVASSGVAGALIGLLFVAISVSRDRLAAQQVGPFHAVRGAAALTAFSNALIVSLFGLVPGADIQGVVLAVSIAGLLSMAALVVSLVRTRSIHPRTVRELLFIIGLIAVFTAQLAVGLHFNNDVASAANFRTLATLLVVCFIVGVARSWELIGGPSIKFKSEVFGLGKDVKSRLENGGSV